MGSGATERYEESLYTAFHVIQDNPEIGRQVGMEQRGVRVFAMRHHLVYYRIEPGVVVILRLINPRQRR